MPDGTIPETGGLGDINQFIQMLTSLFGGGGSTVNSNSQSPEALNASMGLFATLLPELFSGDFSSESAQRDAMGQVELILKDLMENKLPLVAQAEGGAGAYSSTTSALLKNDLSARAAAEGAGRIATTKQQYATIRADKVGKLIQLIQAMAQANKVSNQNTRNNGALDSNTRRRNAALAAAAGALSRGSRNRDRNNPLRLPNPRQQNNDGTYGGVDTSRDDSNANDNGPTPGTGGSDLEGEGSGGQLGYDPNQDGGAYDTRGLGEDQDFTEVDSEGNPLGGDPFEVQGELGEPDGFGGLDDLGNVDFNFGDLDFSFLENIPEPDFGDLIDTGDLGDIGDGSDGGDLGDVGDVGDITDEGDTEFDSEDYDYGGDYED